MKLIIQNNRIAATATDDEFHGLFLMPMSRCASSLQIRPYQACEIAYIALTA